jgi:hypothetical protein
MKWGLAAGAATSTWSLVAAAVQRQVVGRSGLALHTGVSVGDVNGDGLADVLVAAGGSTKDQPTLLINLGSDGAGGARWSAGISVGLAGAYSASDMFEVSSSPSRWRVLLAGGSTGSGAAATAAFTVDLSAVVCNKVRQVCTVTQTPVWKDPSPTGDLAGLFVLGDGGQRVIALAGPVGVQVYESNAAGTGFSLSSCWKRAPVRDGYSSLAVGRLGNSSTVLAAGGLAPAGSTLPNPGLSAQRTGVCSYRPGPSGPQPAESAFGGDTPDRLAVRTSALALGDVDGDDVSDLVEASADGALRLYKGRVTAPLFPSVAALAGGVPARALALASIYGPRLALPDLVVGTADGRVLVFANLGGGAFAKRDELSCNSTGEVSSIAVTRNMLPGRVSIIASVLGGDVVAFTFPEESPTLSPTAPPTRTLNPTTGAPSAPTAKPSTAKPTSPTLTPPTAQPSSAQPSTQPSTAQPSTAQPSTAQPSTAQPSSVQPSTAQPSVAQPSTAPSGTAEPSAAPTSASPTEAPSADRAAGSTGASGTPLPVSTVTIVVGSTALVMMLVAAVGAVKVYRARRRAVSGAVFMHHGGNRRGGASVFASVVGAPSKASLVGSVMPWEKEQQDVIETELRPSLRQSRLERPSSDPSAPPEGKSSGSSRPASRPEQTSAARLSDREIENEGQTSAPTKFALAKQYSNSAVSKRLSQMSKFSRSSMASFSSRKSGASPSMPIERGGVSRMSSFSYASWTSSAAEQQPWSGPARPVALPGMAVTPLERRPSQPASSGSGSDSLRSSTWSSSSHRSDPSGREGARAPERRPSRPQNAARPDTRSSTWSSHTHKSGGASSGQSHDQGPAQEQGSTRRKSMHEVQARRPSQPPGSRPAGESRQTTVQKPAHAPPQTSKERVSATLARVGNMMRRKTIDEII